jgi:hypothetical protein
MLFIRLSRFTTGEDF